MPTDKILIVHFLWCFSVGGRGVCGFFFLSCVLLIVQIMKFFREFPRDPSRLFIILTKSRNKKGKKGWSSESKCRRNG